MEPTLGMLKGKNSQQIREIALKFGVDVPEEIEVRYQVHDYVQDSIAARFPKFREKLSRIIQLKNKRTPLSTLSERQNHRCCYCGQVTWLPGSITDQKTVSRIRYSMATIEHVTPQAHGGNDHDSNLVMACQGCNVLRGSIKSAQHFFNYLHSEKTLNRCIEAISLEFRQKKTSVERYAEKLQEKEEKHIRSLQIAFWAYLIDPELCQEVIRTERNPSNEQHHVDNREALLRYVVQNVHRVNLKEEAKRRVDFNQPS